MSKKNVEAMVKFLKPKTGQSHPKKASGGMRLQVQLAQCCFPVRGDEIVGYVTHAGCTVHRSECRNLLNQPSNKKILLDWDDVLSSGEQCRFIAVLSHDITPEDKKYLATKSVKLIQKKLHHNEVYVVMGVAGSNALKVYQEIKKYLVMNYRAPVYRWGMRQRHGHE